MIRSSLLLTLFCLHTGRVNNTISMKAKQATTATSQADGPCTRKKKFKISDSRFAAAPNAEPWVLVLAPKEKAIVNYYITYTKRKPHRPTSNCLTKTNEIWTKICI